MSTRTAELPFAVEHPVVTTDVVIFSIRDRRLMVLLVRRDRPPFEGAWALPGGSVRANEDLEGCAQRQLADKTGLRGIYLEQLYTFGDPGRDPRRHVISVAYYALAPLERLQLRAAAPGSMDWFPVDGLPQPAFDHATVIRVARERLSAKLAYSTIALQFMPAQFTLSELQEVYEIILDEPVDKRNFRKRILALDLIEDTGRSRRVGSHRPARLYRARNPGHVRIIK